MGAQTEVAADLVVNDRTGATFGKIKHGFDAINSKVDKATAGMMGFVKSTASTALGIKLAGLGNTMSGIYHEAIDAAMAAGKEEKSIAAALMMTDKKNRSYGELREEATGLRKELRHMGMEAGVSGDSVVESFTDIAARTTKTTEQTKVLMESMVQAGRIVPAGLSGITSGFEMIEMGMVRARNPVVQMIASTGLLKGNARAVAKEMMKLSPEQQIALAEKAIVKMADKMKGVPLSFSEAVTSMKDMREEIFDVVGMPIFKGFAPIMRTVREEFKAHHAEIEAWGENVGRQAAEGIKVAGGYVKDIFATIGKNWEGISAGIAGAADALKSTATFLIEHKDTLGRMGMMGTGGYVRTAQGKADASLGTAAGDIMGGAAMGGKLGGPLGAAAGAVFGATGALTEALMGLDSVFELVTGGTRAETDALNAKLTASEKENAIRARSAEGFARSQAYSESLGLDAFGGQRKHGMDTEKTAAMGNLPKDAGFDAAMSGQRFGLDEATKAQTNAMVQEFNTQLSDAIASGEQGRINSLSNVVMNTKQLQFALLNSGVDVGKGFEKIIDAAVSGGTMLSATGDRLKKLLKPGGVPGQGPPTVHVGGGNTITIKQEFREADPDRIMARFKSDFTRAAASRIAARVSGPFGGF